jgi:hypothetical protein
MNLNIRIIISEKISDKMSFKCPYCESILSSKQGLERHIKNTKYCINSRNDDDNINNTEDTNTNIDIDNNIQKLLEEKDNRISQLESQLKDHENLSICKIPLNIRNCTVLFRENDNFVNATKFVRQENKKIELWMKNKNTIAFIDALSEDLKVDRDQLLNTDANNDIWIHPYVSIELARWISPVFNVRMTQIVYNTILKEQQMINTNQKNRIDQLETNLSKRPREKFDMKNVIYILTTDSMKKDRRYIFGKTMNLTNRLSTYNKTDEHIVVYSKSCITKENMNIIEKNIFEVLKDCREVKNRERFILPTKKSIKYFINVVDNCIANVCENTNNNTNNIINNTILNRQLVLKNNK